MNIPFSFFKGEILRNLSEIGINQVVTRNEESCITFIFFFDDFQIFKEIDERVPSGYYISFYQLQEAGFSCELTYYHNAYFERQINNMYLKSLQIT